MTSIESLGLPLVYKASQTPVETSGQIALHTHVRALEGMQKEALVHDKPTGTVWRMVSDEGPYLNGTDLAPFPLAFYTSGMAFSFFSEVLRHAAAANIAIEAARLTQDNFYTMEGSALRGDMVGGALPAELSFEVETDADADALRRLLDVAAASSPAQAYNAGVLENQFSLTFNGQSVDVRGVKRSDAPKVSDATTFEAQKPLDAEARADIITKLNAAETLFDVEGGAGSSLKGEQKRTLHVRGIVTKRDDSLLQCDVQLFKPIGSTFRFLCDEAGEIAPPPLAYLSAGVGFCFMTQVGRYAHIVKQKLSSYRIVQENAFTLEDGQAVARPVDTHLFVEMDDTLADAQQLLRMSEQTCFLHAAMRHAVPSVISLQTSTLGG